MVIIIHLKSILAYKRWTLLLSSYQPNKPLWNVFIETAKYIWWQKYTKYIISSYVVSLVKKIIQWKVKYSSVKIVYAYSLLSWSTTLPVRQCTALLLPCCLRTFSDWVLKVTPLHWMCKKALPSESSNDIVDTCWCRGQRRCIWNLAKGSVVWGREMQYQRQGK